MPAGFRDDSGRGAQSGWREHQAHVNRKGIETSTEAWDAYRVEGAQHARTTRNSWTSHHPWSSAAQQ